MAGESITNEANSAARENLSIVIVLLLAFGLRVVGLDAGSLWQDEAFDYFKSEHWYEVIQGFYTSNHTPLFSLGLALWRFVGFDGEEWLLRLYPASLGVAGVYGLYLAGRETCNSRAALWAALLLAIAPAYIEHAQDLKVYILTPFAAALYVWGLTRAIRLGTRTAWYVSSVCTIFCFQSDVFAWPLVLGICVWAIAAHRRDRNVMIPFVISHAASAILLLPALLIMLGRAQLFLGGIQQTDWWIRPPGLIPAVYFAKTVCFGYSNAKPWMVIATLAMTLTAFAGAIRMYRERRVHFALYVAWAAVPITFLWVVSQFTISLFLYRAMLSYALPVYLFAGAAIDNVHPRGLRALWSCALCLTVIPSLFDHYRGYFAPFEFPNRPGIHRPTDYEAAAEYILSRMDDTDLVLHGGGASWMPFFHYGFSDLRSFAVTNLIAHSTHMQAHNPRLLGGETLFANAFPRSVMELMRNENRCWFVHDDWEREYLAGNSTRCWRWLDANFRERGYFSAENIEVFYFEGERTAYDWPYLRDEDRGATAEVIWQANEQPLTWRAPDTALVPGAPDSRDGPLAVRFAKSADRPADSVIEVEIQNYSKATQPYLIIGATGERVVQCAAMDGITWDSDWNIEALGYSDQIEHAQAASTAIVGTKAGRNARLSCELPLSDFNYDLFVLMRPARCADGESLAGVALAVDEVILQPVTELTPGWQWVRYEYTRESRATGPVHVTILPDPTAGERAELLRAAYIVACARRENANATVSMSKGEVGPASSTYVSIPINEGAVQRCVWLMETSPNGRTYMIARSGVPAFN